MVSTKRFAKPSASNSTGHLKSIPRPGKFALFKHVCVQIILGQHPFCQQLDLWILKYVPQNYFIQISTGQPYRRIWRMNDWKNT